MLNVWVSQRTSRCGNLHQASQASANFLSLARKSALLGGTAALAALLACTGAQAQCTDNFNYVAVTGVLGFSAATGGSAVTSLIATMNTVNTSFLTSSSAFVSSPGGPRPNQDSGGVWSRVVGGEVDTTTTSTTTLNVPPPRDPATGVEHCRTETHQDFAGVQFGYDLAKLNLGGGGANLHFGVTGGYLEARTKDTTPSAIFFNPAAGVTLTSPAGTDKETTKVPFVGLYAAYSQGGFFADAMVRADFYQNALSDPGAAVPYSGLHEDANSISLTGNVGYNVPLGGGWFIEPLGGVIASRLNASSFVLPSFSGIPANNTVQIDTIDSLLGRAGVSVGTNFKSGGLLWQPYVTVGVVHEFAGNASSTQSALVQVCNGVGPAQVCTNETVSLASSIDRFGTYGQYTAGTAVVLGNTGWLGYGRIDYRKGDTIDGVSGNVGLRYQW
jgi:hypothetical protein